MAVKREGETMWKKQPCRHQGQWRMRGEELLRAPEERFACSPQWRPWWSRLSLQPMEVHHGADLHLQPAEDPMPEQMDAWRKLWPHGEPVLEQVPARTCGPVETEKLMLEQVCWWGLWLHGGTQAGAACSWRTAPRERDPCWGSLWRAAACGKDSRWRISQGTVSHGRDLMLEQGQSVRSPPMRRKEQESQRVTNWPQPPFPVPQHHLGGGGRKTEVEPRKKREVGQRCYTMWLYFSLSYSNWIGDKLNFFFPSPSSI